MNTNKQNKTQNDVLVYSYTKKIENKVNEIFAGQTQTFKDKVLFLINLINKNTKTETVNFENKLKGYQLHNDNHTYFFAFRSSDMQLKEIKDLLIKNNVIQMVGQYLVGSVSMEYAITKQYQYDYDKGEVKCNYPTIKDIKKTYLKKYVADHYVVKSSEDTEYQRKSKKTEEEFEQQAEEAITIKEQMNEMQRQINLLVEYTSQFELIKLEQMNNNINIQQQLEQLKNENLQLKEEIKSLKNNTVKVISHENVLLTNNEVETLSDVENTPFFNNEEDDDFGFIFPNEQEKLKLAQPQIIEQAHTADEFDSFIIAKLKSARVQPVYWNNAIQYIKDKKHEANPIELGKLISISTGSTQVIIKKIQQYWN